MCYSRASAGICWCLCRLRIMHFYRYTYTLSLSLSSYHRCVRNGRSLYIFSFNALTPLRGLALYPRRYFATTFPSSPPSSSSFALRWPRREYGRSYNLSVAIGNSLIKFRIADRMREMDCIDTRRDTEEKESFARHIFSLTRL